MPESAWLKAQAEAMGQHIKAERGKVAEAKAKAKKEFDEPGMRRAEMNERGLDEAERRMKEDWKDYSPPAEAPKGFHPIKE